MLVAIHAYEGIYQGLYGIESKAVVEVDSLEEAAEWAREESLDIMSSYRSTYNFFEEEANNENLEPGSKEREDFINEYKEDNIMYDIWVIDKNIKPIHQLDDLFYFSEIDTFIREHCSEAE